MRTCVFFLCISILGGKVWAQNLSIGDFISVEPLPQNSDFVLPPTHTFQRIIEKGDTLTAGGIFPGMNDFAGYVPVNGSSENGYLAINTELTPGGAAILDIQFNPATRLWEVTHSEAVDFDSVAQTALNCSGTITQWNTFVSCEEKISTTDTNGDSRNDWGWCVEIDPTTRQVMDKRWALGNMNHENIAVHENKRTVYEGSDSNPGYIYKFVADTAEDLSSGTLYVYKGSKNGQGNWIQIDNQTPEEQNSTLAQSAAVNATVFNGVEDVEIGPYGWVYFAVKGESRVYRFADANALTGTTVLKMETYVGNTAYEITHANGPEMVNWGFGNDNLAFDGDSNLWVFQDGGENYIWMVENGHTQDSPKVKIFGRTPLGCEPTGITFSPDYRFMFMSIQHPFYTNDSTLQTDAAGDSIGFGKDITLVIAREENLGGGPLSMDGEAFGKSISFYPNPADQEVIIDLGHHFTKIKISVFTTLGQLIRSETFQSVRNCRLDLSGEDPGLYLIRVETEGFSAEWLKVLKR